MEDKTPHEGIADLKTIKSITNIVTHEITAT